MKRLLLLTLSLSACDTGLVGQTYAAAAAEVVRAVIEPGLAPVQADIAARCITDAASRDENLTLARDLGVIAGPSTVALIRDILTRPAAQTCLADAGLPGLEV